jgi:hypothetical protein
VKLDLSSREKEFEKLHFPCEKLFDTFDWQNGYLQYWRFDPAKTELFMRFQAEVLQRFQSYQIPVIKLKKAVKKEAVCHVFEKVNTGGVVLNAFELLTATYAAENFRLRDDWYGSVERKVAGAQAAMVAKKVLRGVQNTDFLQAITLINTYRRRQEDVQAKKPNDEISGVSCKRSAVLALRRADYQLLRDHVLTGVSSGSEVSNAGTHFSGSRSAISNSARATCRHSRGTRRQVGGNRHKAESAAVVLEWGARRTLRGRCRKSPRARPAGSLRLDSGRRTGADDSSRL